MTPLEVAWYPATLPEGKQVEIKQTFGKGRNNGVYLHVRWSVPLNINGEFSRMEKRTVRINMTTGDAKEL